MYDFCWLVNLRIVSINFYIVFSNKECVCSFFFVFVFDLELTV